MPHESIDTCVMQIPTEFADALHKLVAFTPHQWSVMLRVLNEPGTADPAARLAEALDFEHIDCQKIISLLVSFSMAGPTVAPSPQAFSLQLAETVDRKDDGELQDRFTAAILSDTVRVYDKGWELTREHQRFYMRSRIISDCRPIFAGEDDLQPRAWLMSHVLKISYIENGQEQDLFIGMEPGDLANLSEQISRAQAKEDNIHAVLGSAWISGVTDEDAEKS